MHEVKWTSGLYTELIKVSVAVGGQGGEEIAAASYS